MGKHGKLLLRILRGSSDAGIPFEGLCSLLQFLGFDLRIKGSHYIFTRSDIDEILNLQPRNSLAKPYHVKQVRNVIVKYKLGDDEDNDEV